MRAPFGNEKTWRVASRRRFCLTYSKTILHDTWTNHFTGSATGGWHHDCAAADQEAPQHRKHPQAQGIMKILQRVVRSWHESQKSQRQGIFRTSRISKLQLWWYSVSYGLCKKNEPPTVEDQRWRLKSWLPRNLDRTKYMATWMNGLVKL